MPAAPLEVVDQHCPQQLADKLNHPFVGEQLNKQQQAHYKILGVLVRSEYSEGIEVDANCVANRVAALLEVEGT